MTFSRCQECQEWAPVRLYLIDWELPRRNGERLLCLNCAREEACA